MSIQCCHHGHSPFLQPRNARSCISFLFLLPFFNPAVSHGENVHDQASQMSLRDFAQAYLHYVINTRNKKSPSSAPWYFLHCNVVYFCLKVVPRVCQFSFSSCKAKGATTKKWYFRSVINSYSTSPRAVMHSSHSYVIRRNADRGQNWQATEYYKINSVSHLYVMFPVVTEPISNVTIDFRMFW